MTMQFKYELEHDYIFPFLLQNVVSLIKRYFTSQDPTMLLIYSKVGLTYDALL